MEKSSKAFALIAIALVVMAVFSLFVISYERRFQRKGEADTHLYGQQLAPYLWDINVETAREYVTAVEGRNDFHSVEVQHNDGEVFLNSEVIQASEGMEGLLSSIGLLRDDRFSCPIEYGGKKIGMIYTERVNRSVFVYFYLLPVAVLLYVVFVLGHAVLLSRKKRLLVEGDFVLCRQRLEAVLEGTPTVEFSLDQSGAVTFCGGKALEKLGLGGDDMLGMLLPDIVGKLPILEEDFQKAMQGERFSKVRNVGSYSFETCFFPVEADGRQIGVNAVSTDITMILDAVDQLRQRDAELGVSV